MKYGAGLNLGVRSGVRKCVRKYVRAYFGHVSVGWENSSKDNFADEKIEMCRFKGGW